MHIKYLQKCSNGGINNESGHEIAIDSYKEKILEYCEQPKTAKEIREYLNINSRQYVSTNLISPLISEGKLNYVNKENIKSKNQKYITVKKV